MRLKKGMTLIAIGFLFVSFCFNIDLKGSVLTLPPPFIGWILFVLAYPNIVKYTSYNVSFYWIPLVLAVYSALEWVLALISLSLNLPLIATAAGILVIVYLVKLLGSMELLARDYAPSRIPRRLHTLKVLYLSLEIAMIVFTVLAEVTPISGFFLILDLITILAAIVVTIVICVTLFQLRKAIPDEDLPPAGNDPTEGDFGPMGTN